MEHRWSPRNPIDVDVVIYHQQLGKMRGTGRNICLEGMFVEMDARKLHRNAFVDLVVALRIGSQSILYRLRALVVYVANTGAGFMFRDFDINFFRYLQRMLSNPHPTDFALLSASHSAKAKRHSF